MERIDFQMAEVQLNLKTPAKHLSNYAWIMLLYNQKHYTV